MSAAKNEQQTPQKRTNPLQNSRLFSNDAAPAPALPPLPTVAPSPVAQPEPAPMPEQVPTSGEQPLYRSRPSAEYRMRPFDRRYDKQAINVNPYYAGAMEALAKVTKTSKTEQLEEMMRWYLAQHEQDLLENEDVVLLSEQKYKDKFKI